jgi:hypothetical protein
VRNPWICAAASPMPAIKQRATFALFSQLHL